jgi:hypothetical protein
MRAYTDEQLQELVDDAFAAGQEHMRNRAMLRTYHAIGIETGGEDLRLARKVTEYMSGMKIYTLTQVKEMRSAPDTEPFRENEQSQ